MSIFNSIKRVQHNVSNLTINTYKNLLFTDKFLFNTDYHRDYFWTEKEQQGFLKNLLSSCPVGYFLFSTIHHHFNQNYTYEVIDGKQRLTTIKMFFNNKIPIIIEGKKVFYTDFTSFEKLKFKSHLLPAIILIDSMNKKQKLQLFYDINFSSVQQSEEHKHKIEELLNKE